jgi:hypothetical protein
MWAEGFGSRRWDGQDLDFPDARFDDVVATRSLITGAFPTLHVVWGISAAARQDWQRMKMPVGQQISNLNIFNNEKTTKNSHPLSDTTSPMSFQPGQRRQ